MRLYASLASCDPLRIAQSIDQLGDWPDFHFDIEDGNFTSNITFGLKALRATAGYLVPRRLNVHMMVMNPFAFLPALSAAGVEQVCAHVEALRYPMEFLAEARRLGMKAGLALNIGTPYQAVTPFLQQMDYLLVMTAEPDGSGEQLNEFALGKAEVAARTLPIPVFADGALNRIAVQRLHAAGCGGCVLGRLVFGAENPGAALAALQASVSAAGQ